MPSAAPLKRIARRIPVVRGVASDVLELYRTVGRQVRAVRDGVKVSMDTEQARLYGRTVEGRGLVKAAVDNVVWTYRHGKPNALYYVCAMDEKAGDEYADFLSYHEMWHLIDRQIEEDKTGQIVAVLKNKYLFSLVAQALGHRSPRALALLRPDGVDALDPRRSVSYAEFVAGSGPADAFAKPVGGMKGKGAFALRIEDGRTWIDDEPATAAEVAGRVTGRYLLQERLVQHPALEVLHPSSVNTIRLVTVYRDGGVRPFVAALRVGTGGATVDNWSAGGLVVGLDLDTGRLYGRGIFKPGCGGDVRYGGFVDRHPDSGLDFDGYQLPDIPEAVELACRLHLDLGGPRTVGWDLAITPNGPSIVEGNSHWSGAMYMAIDGGFKKRYFEAAGIGE